MKELTRVPDAELPARMPLLVHAEPTAENLCLLCSAHNAARARDVFGDAHVEARARDSALAVPERAVQTGLGRQFVYVVGAGDTVRMRDVETGPWSDGQWIINRGLSPGDRVIVDGIQKVAPRRVAKPVPLADSTAAPAPSALGDSATRGAR